MAWRHFTKDEFSCNCCGCNEISTELVDILDDMREELSFPLRITSGYRCPEHNNRVSSTGRDGPHTTGLAADISIMGHQAHAFLSLAFAKGFTGIGVKQKGNMHRRFIHVDLLDSEHRFRPTIWSY